MDQTVVQYEIKRIIKKTLGLPEYLGLIRNKLGCSYQLLYSTLIQL